MNVIPAKAGIQKKGWGVFSYAEGASPGMTIKWKIPFSSLFLPRERGLCEMVRSLKNAR